jgi:hypothetical protein
MNRAGAILRLATLPRSRPSLLPQCGRGAGGEGGPSPSPPPAPLPLPRCGRGRGKGGPHLSPYPFLSHQGRERGDEPSRGDPAAGNATAFTTLPAPAVRERKGGGRPLTFPPAPSSPTRGEKGGTNRAGAILRLATLPRSRPSLLPQCGRGAGGEGGPSPSPPAPPSSPTLRERKGGERPSPSPLPSSYPIRGEKGGRAGGVLRGRGDEPSRGDPAAGNATAFTTLPAPAVRERGRG